MGVIVKQGTVKDSAYFGLVNGWCIRVNDARKTHKIEKLSFMALQQLMQTAPTLLRGHETLFL